MKDILLIMRALFMYSVDAVSNNVITTKPTYRQPPIDGNKTEAVVKEVRGSMNSQISPKIAAKVVNRFFQEKGGI
jgi:hypothetical protein